MSVSLDHELEQLDRLLAVLAASPEREAHLVEEHAQFARAYLLGAMPGEYEANLAMAQDAAGQIPDQAMREKVLSIVEAVISSHQAR